ncbi:MAG TPA: polyprenyl diphosphate synthase [Candidatus Limnocylindria bacterium]|nr:polyprenyl diphosphate synthase [Candidatus Limnocylindria bacterium]
MTSLGVASSAARPGAGEDAAQPEGADLLPRHVAIIMDGNRRWARLHGKPEAEGHAAGVAAIRPIVERAAQRGVAALSIFAFSRENWARASEEVETLFSLLEAAIRDETPELVQQGIRVAILGRLEELPERTRHSIRDALEQTSGGTTMVLNVAFNYSGRSEIVDAARHAINDGLTAQQIDETALSARLYSAGLPELDLLIRTGGEQRISNFLIWQAAYAELYFSDRLWPDFDPTAFDAALAEYARRSRRFGR